MPIYCILPEGHFGLFGSYMPVERKKFYNRIFGYGSEHFSDFIYPQLTDHEKNLLYRKYVKRVRLSMLKGVAQKSDITCQWIIESIKKDGVVVPLVVGVDMSGTCQIIEGHRRAGAATLSDMERVPAFVFLTGRPNDQVKSDSKQMTAYKRLVS